MIMMMTMLIHSIFSLLGLLDIRKLPIVLLVICIPKTSLLYTLPSTFLLRFTNVTIVPRVSFFRCYVKTVIFIVICVSGHSWHCGKYSEKTYI